ncbi:MAG: hypothetical protein KBG24_03155 [Bacteroidia bacterium]|nr:hypothetical protein [Bacteroidia bacterium]
MRSRFIEQSFFLYTVVAVLSISCKKDTPDTRTTPLPPSGKVKVNIAAYAGEVPLTYGDVYTNAANEKFKVSLFRYYLTNLVLEGEGNTPDYVQPESYYLIDHSGSDGVYNFVLNNVPSGKYRSIRYTIGVDSLRNVSGAQTGALDPAAGMFWTWSSGYIQFKVEGTLVNPTGEFIYHVGGFHGPFNPLSTSVTSFNQTLSISKGVTKKLNLKADVLEVFNTPAVWEISSVLTIINSDANSKQLANNYADMIKFISITD